jgi:hypothetical protein
MGLPELITAYSPASVQDANRLAIVRRARSGPP